MKTKKKNAFFGRYPCCDLVNNAIRCILNDNPDEAISELYHAIIKAGGYIHEDVQIPAIEAKDRALAKHRL